MTTPLFDGEESYIAYPPLINIHDDLRVELEFKPLQRDGVMFFCGGKKMKVEDFVAISMVEGHVEFRYELGTGNWKILFILFLKIASTYAVERIYITLQFNKSATLLVATNMKINFIVFVSHAAERGVNYI